MTRGPAFRLPDRHGRLHARSRHRRGRRRNRGHAPFPDPAARRRAAGSSGETRFGATDVAAPEAASSSVSRSSVAARLACASGGQRSDAIPSSRWAPAWISEGSTPKASPPARPSAMRRAGTASHSRRNRSQSRNRPRRFVEKVEGSGAASVRSIRQNQRPGRFRRASWERRRSARMPKQEPTPPHPDPPLGIDRGPADPAAERREPAAEDRAVDEAVDRADERIWGNVRLKAELAKEAPLRPPPFAHHTAALSTGPETGESTPRSALNPPSSTKKARSGRSPTEKPPPLPARPGRRG